MTEQEIAGLGPAFAAYLGRFRSCFRQKRTAAHFDNYCRGLLSDLPRKTVEPIALESGTAVRTLQEFLTTTCWEHDEMGNRLQRHLAQIPGSTHHPLPGLQPAARISSRKAGSRAAM